MFTIVTDGGNRDDITYGSFKIYDDEGKVIAHRQMVFGYGTSNLAEYLALIRSLKFALAHGYNNVVILTDSKLIKKQIEGKWACNYTHLRVARDQARTLLNKFEKWKINKITRNIVASHLGH